MRTRRATARLLWSACRPAPRADEVTTAVRAGADVPRAAHVALRQYTGPLLWRALDGADLLDHLGAFRKRLRVEFEVRRGQVALLLPVGLAAAIEPLARAGLEPVVFKGPGLAIRYPEPGLRPMDDIDLLLPPDQHQAGIDALTGAGWHVWRGNARHDHDTVLHHASVPHLPVELHRGLESWRDRAHGLGARELWARRTPMDCLGVATFGLPVEDELVMLAAHAAKPFHCFHRLIWSVDLAVAIGTAGDTLDWDLVRARAHDARCATALAVGLRHAQRLGAVVPEELVALPASAWRRAGLAPVLDEGWPFLAGDERTAHRLRYALPDARRDRALLAVGEVAARGPAHIPARAVQLASNALRQVRTVRRTTKLTTVRLNGAAR
jgi:hypothetical protein